MRNITLKELKTFFSSAEIPATIDLNSYSRITNVQNFIDTHISFLEHNSGNKTFKPYYDRLIELLNIL